MEWARPASPWALPTLVFVAIALVLAALAPEGTAIDYAVFERAGARFLRGEALYPSNEFFAFKYAPVAAAFFAPFSLLPQRMGWLLVNLTSSGILVCVLRWAFARFEAKPRSLQVALVLAMTAPYYGHLIWLGQTDGLVLGLLVASEVQAERRPVVSGMLWALASLVKLPFLVLLVAIAILRQWRRLLGFGAGIFVWLALGAVRYGIVGGWAQTQAWVRTLSHSTPGIICWEFNQSLFAMICTYLPHSVGTPRFAVALAAGASAVVASGLGAVAMIARHDRRQGRFALFAFALYLGALLSPLGWNTNLLVTLPLAVALARVAADGSDAGLRRMATGAAVAVSLLNCIDLILLPFRIWDDTPRALFWYRQYGIAGLVLAGSTLACAAVHARRRAPVLSRRAFDYEAIPQGHYDRVLREGSGIRRLWHLSKFERVLDYLPARPGQSILDIGCFAGTFLSMADPERFSRQLGVDILRAQIDYAEARHGTPFRQFRYLPSITHLGEVQERIDCVTVIEVIEHLTTDEIRELLRHVARVLSPGGKLVVTTPNYASAWPLLELLLNRFGDVSYEEQHITRFTYFNLEERLAQIQPSFPNDFKLDMKTSTHFVTPFLAGISFDLAHRMSRVVPHDRWRLPFGNLILSAFTRTGHR